MSAHPSARCTAAINSSIMFPVNIVTPSAMYCLWLVTAKLLPGRQGIKSLLSFTAPRLERAAPDPVAQFRCGDAHSRAEPLVMQPFHLRSAARNFALRERGLFAISFSVAVTGFFVRLR